MIIFAGGMFLTSCDKTELVAPNENEGLEKSAEEIVLTQNDADRELLAKIVAKALAEEDFRTIIKSEAMLMFDGDYDVLYNKVGKKQNAKGNSIESYLLNTYNQMKGKNASQSEFEKLVSFIPDFQISVPVNCEEWDTKNYTPLVTYIPANLDEATAKTTRAFDSNGKLHILSLEKEPEMPVVVIGSCERVDEKGEVKGQIMQISDKPIIEENDKVTRQSGMKEYVYKIKFNDLSSVEKWYLGGPEIKVAAKTSDGGIDYKTTWNFNNKRAELNDEWYYCYCFISGWYFSDPEVIHYIFYEDDSDRLESKHTFGVSYTLAGMKISYEMEYEYGNSDKEILEISYDTRDPKYRVYATGTTMEFGVAFWF